MKATKIASAFLDAGRPTNDEQKHNVYEISQDRKPMITPSISSNGNSDGGQKFILIPNNDHILVKSLEHGQNVLKLVTGDDFRKPPTLHTATILEMKKGSMSNEEFNDDNTMDADTSSTEYIVLAGFSDGCMREWNLSAIPYTKNNGVMMPRRTFKFGFNGCVTHLTSPSGNGANFSYALVRMNIGSRKEAKLVKFSLPVCDDLSEVIILDFEHLAGFWKNRSFKKGSGANSNSHDQGKELRNFVTGSSPFALLSTSADKGNGKKDYFVAICHGRGLVIYYENAGKFTSLPKTQSGTLICAAAMSPNGVDISLGYESGIIDILTSVLTQTAEYINDDTNGSDTKHPRNNLVTRTIHWHALPVKALCYLGTPGSRATPILLSGGEEAVLVTWSIDRGLNRPAHTLPRISKGCITHIATHSHPSASGGSTDIVVKCLDETLQLIQGHNHATRWKVQGLACALNECVVPAQPLDGPGIIPSPILQIDPKSKVPMLTRMAGAPGFIHWFDPKSSQVIGELEVSAYNRISRKEASHKSYPRPTVTHLACSKTGNDLITVDTMLSENTGVGKFCRVKPLASDNEDASEEMSYVTNIKFWAWSKDLEKNVDKRGNGMPYELIAAMPAPHGVSKGSIDALAISPDGSKACTLSLDEGAIHIWEKGRTVGVNNGSTLLSSPSLPSWRRLCKIAIPAGYSNASKLKNDPNNNLVAFSSDGSVVAIAFGRHITLWDHTTATMLNCVQALEPLKEIRFVKSPVDMILATGDTTVSILPPFGNGYLGNASWSYRMPQSLTRYKSLKLELVTPLLTRKELAVAMTRKDRNGSISTEIIVVDLLTAKRKAKEDGSNVRWEMKGSLQALHDISNLKYEWSSSTEQAKAPALLAVTSQNEMYVLEEDNIGANLKLFDDSTIPKGSFSKIENIQNAAALTSMSAPQIERVKRKRVEKTGNSAVKRQSQANPMTGALLFDKNSIDTDSGPVPTSQLPALSGSFARSFIARNIKKTS